MIGFGASTLVDVGPARDARGTAAGDTGAGVAESDGQRSCWGPNGVGCITVFQSEGTEGPPGTAHWLPWGEGSGSANRIIHSDTQQPTCRNMKLRCE